MRRLLAVTLLLATTACGSTVQLRGTVAGDSGLSPQQQLGAGSSTSTGAVTAPGAGGGTTGLTQGGTSGGGTSGTVGSPVVPGTSGAGSLPPATGVAGDHSPIQIGFVTTSVGNAEALGVNAGQSYTDKAMLEALVAEYNAQGGVAGHKIVPVYGATDTASSNWANQFNAVCAQFTQDHHVRAVIGYIFVFLPSFESCLAKARVPHLYGGYQPGDVVDQQQYPTVVATGHPTVDGFSLTALEGALRSGLINAKTKLGLIIDTCANGDRAYARTVEPWLKAHRVNYKTVVGDCAQGASDVSGAASAISSAELSFASSGVNLVFGNGVELLVFMEDAQSQGYTPEYLTAVGGAALEANAPASQMKHLHGFGWMPSVDVNPQHQPYPQTPAQKACVSKLVKHGLHPSAYNDFMAAYQACDGLDLYAKALAAKGSAASAMAVVDGVVAALPSFRGAGTYAGAQQAASHQRGGPASYRAYAWTDSCSCLTYRGPVYPVPNP